jgi:hypothetical protein
VQKISFFAKVSKSLVSPPWTPPRNSAKSLTEHDLDFRVECRKFDRLGFVVVKDENVLVKVESVALLVATVHVLQTSSFFFKLLSQIYIFIGKPISFSLHFLFDLYQPPLQILILQLQLQPAKRVAAIQLFFRLLQLSLNFLFLHFELRDFIANPRSHVLAQIFPRLRIFPVLIKLML